MVLSSLSGIWHISLLSFKTSNRNAFTIFISDLVFSICVIIYLLFTVFAPPCQSQTHDDFLIAQVLQEVLQNYQDPETERLQADIIPGPTKENFPAI
jgi:hypothetical protein